MALLETDYFITIWKTTTNNESITIPVFTNSDSNGSNGYHPVHEYSYDVDWGDNNGTFETGFTDSATHTYTTPGEYRVKIRGRFPHLYFNYKGDKDKIISIEQWGSIEWKSMSRAFFGCSNLVGNATDRPNLSQVTNMELMFSGASLFNQPIGDWNISNVTDIYGIFLRATSFNQPIGDWNVSKVSNMQSMFQEASSFNQDISNWNVSNVTNMWDMFREASLFNQPIGDWDVSKVTFMRRMFQEAGSFNQPIGNWDVSNVTDMGDMFREATSFNQPIGDWNVGNVTNMGYMFFRVSTFNQPIGNWNVSKVTGMYSMFNGASSFNQPIGDWNVGQVSNINSMFNGASSFNQDISNWDVSNVTNMSYMFFNASSFNQDISNWDVSNVTSMAYTFYGASLFNQSIGNWNVSNVTDMQRMFLRAVAFNQPIGSWNVDKVVNMHQMFFYANLFNQPIGNWKVGNVEDMAHMFRGASSFNQPIEDWDVSNVTTMAFMFSGTSSFNQSIGSWNVSNVTNMEHMFNGASVFDQHINNWDVSNVTNMRLMFYATSFDQNIGNWNVSKVTDMSYMFGRVKLSIANYDALLIGWSTRTLQQNVTFDGGNSNYCKGEIARTNLINNFNWRITDAGKLCRTFDLVESTITADPGIIKTNGIEHSVITVQLKDEQGENITEGGETVVILTTTGTITATTDNGDGTYTASLTTTIVGTGSAILSFTVNGNEASKTAAVKFIVPVVDLLQSTITANPNTIEANGVEFSTITVQLKDAQGENITEGGKTVIILTSLGIISSTIDNGNGTYTATLTATNVGVAVLSFTVDSISSPNTTEVSLTPAPLELTNSTKLQSTNLYVQAAGSTGNDGSVKGVHLRWLLKGYLGDTHLPKGNNATTTHHFNKPDDFVRIYRAPYEPQYLTLDFENLSPSVVDHSNYLWVYRINEVPFYVYFKNKLQYNRVKGTTNALTNSYSFIQNYGNNIIEIDHKTTLSFAVIMKAASASASIEAEVLSVEDNTLTAPKYVTARKEFVGEGRLEEENIRTLRYKANHIKEIQFELYADALTHNLVEEKWAFVGEYALTTEDNVAENRLEPSNNTASIHGEWPRFNDGDTVNKDNYIDRWNGEETQSYNTVNEPAYYEYYDRRLKTTVKRFIELSDANASNPVAMEGIPFGTTLPEGVTSQEEDTQDISNLTILQLASMDYHLARMLGLGHIDTSIDTNEEAKKYVYLAEYKTTHNVSNGLNDNGAKDIQHIFLSLPTAITDERLPIPVNLQEPVLGIHNSTNENITELVDNEGYLYDGKQRFISLINEELPNNQTNLGFFEERTLFSTAETTTPVYAGIEYKLFDPANPNASNWRKPELSNTAKYKNYAIGDNSSAEFNEAVPILVPEANEVLFLHREREEGWHRYSSYGINWFSRSQQSTVFWDVETNFRPQNRLLPPSNIKACLIVEESPLMLTSAKEQELFAAITTEDKTLVRLTFNHNINQDKITYQINEESMGTFTNPLDENAIYRDDKEVFADQVNIFFRNKSPKTVAGKIKSIETHANNALAIIRTEDYYLVSTKTTITPEILPNEFSHFVGSVFMFNDIKYIIHEVAASTVTDEGPIFTVYKELVSEAMLNGTEPDPTLPLELPTFNSVTMFNTVENMLTESNWKVEESATINKLDFQINVGNNWPVHREVIDEESISGVPEQILEKSRGIWETAVIEEARRPEENIYDKEGALIAEPKHVGMYKITFPNSLDHHSQFTSHNVDWYQGIVRIHTQNNPTKKRKVLEVVKIENVDTSNPLVIYALDPQYPTNIEDVNSVPGFEPILTGSQEVNFYPGYRVYLYHDATHHLTEEAILPSRGEGLKYSILGLQSVDPDYPESATNPNEWYISKISQPAQFFAQEVIRPEIPLLSNGEEFVYATRPDTFGKSTFSLTPGFRHIPHGVQFYRSNDDAVLNALYKPSTVIEIKEKLKEDIDSKFHLVKRWQNLLGFNFEYEETFQTDNEFFIYPEDETGYRFPKPDKYELYESINNVLEYRNDNYGTTYSLLDLGDRSDDTNNGTIGTINLTDVVIPKLESEGINNDVTFKDYIQSVIHNAFTPLTEIPLMYQYIKDSDYQPVAKKQVIRDASGSLLPPNSDKFDMAPMAKRMSTEFINEIPGADTRILFTDFNLDGTSDNLYFYAIREMGNTMQLGDFSPVLGPVKLVNTKPPKSPSVRRILPILQNKVLNINPGISVEINAYPKVENIKQIKLYRTLEPSKALSVRTMDLVTIIDLEADGQITSNIWKLKDEFTDLGYVPYGDPLYYRVTVLREVEYADGSNTVKDGHPQITEYVPSESSKLLISSIVENANPEAPALEYNFDVDPTDISILQHVILKWNKKVHNGKYHVYKMNTQGNWVNIHSLSSNVEDVQLLLDDTSLENGTLKVTTEAGDVRYHHFKVVSENSTGMMSTEEKILTIPNVNNIDDEEGVGDMIVENTNIVR